MVFVVAHFQNGLMDFYEIFYVYLVGMRIGHKVDFISLGNSGVLIQSFFFGLASKNI